MVNLYLNENFNKADCKIIIFDFDETLYYAPNIRQHSINYQKSAITTLTNKTEEEAEKLMKQYGYTLENKNAEAFGNSIQYFGISPDDWDKFKKEHLFLVPKEEIQIVPNEIFKALSKKYKLYIVSRDFFENIGVKANLYGIDLSNFDEIICPKAEDNYFTPKSKTPYYEMILKKNNCKPNNVIVIGDRYKVDILPIEEIGGSGIQIQTTEELAHTLKTQFL